MLQVKQLREQVRLLSGQPLLGAATEGVNSGESAAVMRLCAHAQAALWISQVRVVADMTRSTPLTTCVAVMLPYVRCNSRMVVVCLLCLACERLAALCCFRPIHICFGA